MTTFPAAEPTGGEATSLIPTPAQIPAAPRGPRSFITGGLDYTPAYYRRGYLQDNNGLIVQPFLTLACCLNPDGPVVVQPYLTSWNSFGLLNLNDPMAVMVEGMGGVFVTWGNLNVDTNYAIYNSSPVDGTSTLTEIGLKVSYDVWPLLIEPEAISVFALRPFAALFWETYDQKGTNDGYWELGLEPIWRLKWGQQRIGLTVPVQFGLSADNYYFDARGQEQLLGYVGVGLAASTTLPPPPRCGGKWFLSCSLQYTRLIADNLITINNGSADVITGKVGIGFSF